MLRLIRRKSLEDAYLREAYENRPVGRMIRAGLRNELSAARYALRPLPRRRFLIFAQGRSGSTLLTNTLDTHPEITCKDEILDRPHAFPLTFIKNVASGCETDCFGFHVKIYQLTAWQRVEDVHRWLSSVRKLGWNILYLRRENLLRQAVSNVFAEVAGAFHHRSGEVTKRPEEITLPVERMLAAIAWRKENIAAEREALSGLDYLELVYERDLESSESQTHTFKRIQEYLGVEPMPLSPSLRKAVAKPLQELITNYDEVRDALLGTPDEVFLDD